MDRSHTLLAMLACFFLFCFLFQVWRGPMINQEMLEKYVRAAERAAMVRQREGDQDPILLVNTVLQSVKALTEDAKFMAEFNREMEEGS